MATQTNGKLFSETYRQGDFFPAEYLKDFLGSAGYEFDEPSFRAAFKPDATFMQHFQEVLDTGKSCGNDMLWSILRIQPDRAFQLHAHPNIEINYVVKGTLHQKYIPANDFTLPKELFGQKQVTNTALPFDSLQESCVRAGSMLLNLPGSTHQSFTKDEEVVLLCLFSSKWNFFVHTPDVESHFLPITALKSNY
jgi:hypothetical protein